MKIAIPTFDGKTVAPIFGRAPKFVIIDGKKRKEIANPGFNAWRGAGVTAAQTLVSEGVNAVITGNVGPNAYAMLATAGIEVYWAPGLSIEEAVEKLKQGELQKATPAGRWGWGPGYSGGRGLGLGRGRGRGRRR